MQSHAWELVNGIWGGSWDVPCSLTDTESLLWAGTVRIGTMKKSTGPALWAFLPKGHGAAVFLTDLGCYLFILGLRWLEILIIKCESVDKHSKYNLHLPCTHPFSSCLWDGCHFQGQGWARLSVHSISGGIFKQVHSLFHFLLASPSSSILPPPCFPSTEFMEWGPSRRVSRVHRTSHRS